MYNQSTDLIWLIYSSLLIYFGPGLAAGVAWLVHEHREELLEKTKSGLRGAYLPMTVKGQLAHGV